MILVLRTIFLMLFSAWSINLLILIYNTIDIYTITQLLPRIRMINSLPCFVEFFCFNLFRLGALGSARGMKKFMSDDIVNQGDIRSTHWNFHFKCYTFGTCIIESMYKVIIRKVVWSYWSETSAWTIPSNFILSLWHFILKYLLQQYIKNKQKGIILSLRK